MSGLVVRRILDDQNHDDLVGGGVGDGGVGPWRDMPGVPGFTSYARYRLVPLGVQLAGQIDGSLLEVNSARQIGSLPPDAAPATMQAVPVAVSGGTGATTGLIIVYPDGGMWYWGSVAGAGVIYLSAILALD